MSEVAVQDPTVQSVGQQLVKSAGQEELDKSARLGMWLAAAESGSNDPNALGMAAALRIAYAGSLGLPAHAASEVYVIKGNLTLSSKLLRALAHQHGLHVERVDESPESCTAAVVVDATGKELGRTTFTLEQARKMGLSGTNWTNNTERMLWARASKRALDDFAPWVTVGVLLDDEAAQMGSEPVPFDADEVLVGEVMDEVA